MPELSESLRDSITVSADFQGQSMDVQSTTTRVCRLAEMSIAMEKSFRPRENHLSYQFLAMKMAKKL